MQISSEAPRDHFDWTLFISTHNEEEGQQYLTENNLTISLYA